MTWLVDWSETSSALQMGHRADLPRGDAGFLPAASLHGLAESDRDDGDDDKKLL